MLPLNYLLFLQIIIFLFITPGTPRMVIISYSMNYGIQKCIWTALGDISANFIQAILVIFFIGTFFSDYPEFLNTIKWLGVAYLLYLAYDIYTSVPKNLIKKNIRIKSFFSFYRDGFLVAGLSPKAIVFFGTIFTSFIDFEANILVQFIILITTYVILDFTTLMMYGFAAKKIASYLNSKPNLLNKLSALALILIALFVALNK